MSIHIEYLMLVGEKWQHVKYEAERESDGKIHVKTPEGAVLDYFLMKETVDGKRFSATNAEFGYGPSAEASLGDVVFEDPTLLERTYAWMAKNRAHYGDAEETNDHFCTTSSLACRVLSLHGAFSAANEKKLSDDLNKFIEGWLEKELGAKKEE